MKLIPILIAIAFASTLNFGAVAAQYIVGAPAATPAAEAAPAPAKKAKAMTGNAAAK